MRNIHFVLTLFMVVNLSAQTLSLQESIDGAVENYPDVKTFELKIKESQASYKSAFSAYLPQINLEAQYNVIQTYVLPQNGLFHTKDDNGWNAGATLKQKIWDFSKTSSQVDAQKVQKDISNLSLKDFKALLAYKVKGLYALMVVQDEAIKVRQKDLEAKKAYYAQAEVLVAQGLKTKADASRFLSAVYEAKDALYSAKSSYEKARNTLSLYMNKKIADDVVLDKSVIVKKIADLKDTSKEVLSKNYNLLIDAKRVQKNILLHKSAKASHYGSVDAVASYNRVDTLNAYDTTLAGVMLNIPLYSGGRVSAEAQKAEIGAQISKEQKRSREIALKEEVDNILYDIKKYEHTIEAKKAQLIASTEAKKVLDGRYKAGLATYIEVLDATSEVLNAKLALLEAYYLRTLSLYRIDYLKGKM